MLVSINVSLDKLIRKKWATEKAGQRMRGAHTFRALLSSGYDMLYVDLRHIVSDCAVLVRITSGAWLDFGCLFYLPAHPWST